SPWGDLKGKPINDRALARRLRQYGVKSKKLRVGDTTAMGYAREDLVDAWLRYLPLSPTEAEQAEQEDKNQKNRDFSCSGYEDVQDSERNTPSERNEKSPTGSSIVPDVPDVPLVRGNRGEAPGDDLAIPAFLDRSRKQVPDRLCPLGPGGDGDSLDDFK